MKFMLLVIDSPQAPWIMKSLIDVIKVACNFSEALNSLIKAYMEIGELLPQLQAYQQHCISNAYMRMVLALMYKDILEFHAVALKYFRKPSRSTTWNRTSFISSSKLIT